MSQDIQFNGLVVAADVVETIVRLSAEKVDGVACVGSSTDLPTVFSMFGSKKVSSVPAVGVKVEDDAMRIAVHVSVFFGFPFKKLAEEIRSSVSAGVESQVGISVSGVDVFIDALVFAKE